MRRTTSIAIGCGVAYGIACLFSLAFLLWIIVLEAQGPKHYITVLNAANAAPLLSVKRSADITSAVFSANGKFLAFADRSGYIGVYDLSDGNVICEKKVGEAEWNDVRLSADGKYVSSSYGNGKTPHYSHVRMWRTADCKEMTLPGEMYGVRFSPDGKLMALLGIKIGVFRLANWSYTYAVADGGAEDVAFSPSGNKLAAAYQDANGGSTVVLWRATDGAMLHKMKVQLSYPRFVTFSMDEQLLAVSSAHRRGIAILGANDGRSICTLDDNTPVALSPDGRHLSSGAGRAIENWNPKECGKVGKTSVNLADIYSLLYMSNEDLLVEGMHDEKDGPGTDILECIHVPNGKTAYVLKEKRLLTASTDGKSIAVTDPLPRD